MIGFRCLEELGQVATVSWNAHTKTTKQKANSVLTSSKRNNCFLTSPPPPERKTQRVKTSDGKPNLNVPHLLCITETNCV